MTPDTLITGESGMSSFDLFEAVVGRVENPFE